MLTIIRYRVTGDRSYIEDSLELCRVAQRITRANKTPITKVPDGIANKARIQIENMLGINKVS
jgi:hypothetical protein